MSFQKTLAFASIPVWIFVIGFGFVTLAKYENKPGVQAKAHSQWPAHALLKPASDKATLVMFAHPQCPCTRASVGELAKIMAREQNNVAAYVIFLSPAETDEAWVKTDLWKSAAAIPGVSVIADKGGIESDKFGVVTSGQVFLYSENGQLLFHGGITESRGHNGDNEGESAIISLLEHNKTQISSTNVFGCPLVNPGSSTCSAMSHQPAKP